MCGVDLNAMLVRSRGRIERDRDSVRTNDANIPKTTLQLRRVKGGEKSLLLSQHRICRREEDRSLATNSTREKVGVECVQGGVAQGLPRTLRPVRG